MKALEQNYRNGKLQVVEVPEPKAGPGQVVVYTTASLASVGTEKSMVELARKNLLGKARARPDLVRQVIDKVRTDGILDTWRQVMGRLETPILLGYSSAGTVTAVGPGASEFKVGDRVACAGSGYAGHIEAAAVPTNLCVPIPADVSFEEASFVALGGIALEAVRMARISLGDRVVVIGLGLLGQIAVQLLKAAGCHVFGTDLDPRKTELAARHGAEATCSEADSASVVQAVDAWSGSQGADAVIILAATSSNGPLEQAAAMCRERGRVVATGLVGLDVPRRTFYDKELELVVSRAWGPGIYDSHYTREGVDYPLAYARWTAQRNLEEFLEQLAGGSVAVQHLITHRIPIEQALEAYEMILEGREHYIGVVLTYPEKPKPSPVADQQPAPSPAKELDGAHPSGNHTVWLKERDGAASTQEDAIGVGLIGAGLFTMGTLLPVMGHIKGLRRRGVATSTGLSGRHAASKFGFEYFTTDYQEVLADPQVDCVLITTRHNLHAPMARAALQSGKDVFLEKPLATDLEQLQGITEAYRSTVVTSQDGEAHESRPRLMVGFNRRFSPFAVKARELLKGRAGPLIAQVRVNAGAVPPDHWVNDPVEGGGRIIGEVCHFVDLVQFFAGASPVRAYADAPRGDDENVAITLSFPDGSLASIVYTASGDRGFPRERVELFWDESVCLIDNFKSLLFTRKGKRQRMKRWNLDRGYRGELNAFFDAIQKNGPPPVPFTDYVHTTLTTFCIVEAIRTSKAVEIDLAGSGLAL